jgi:hypothetical protein
MKFGTADLHVISPSSSKFRENRSSANNTLFTGVSGIFLVFSTFLVPAGLNRCTGDVHNNLLNDTSAGKAVNFLMDVNGITLPRVP